MMHAARDKPMRVRRAALAGGGCGPGPCWPVPCWPGPCVPSSCGPGPAEAGPAEGGRASSRSILASCSVRRVSCSSARLICSWACVSPSSARGAGASPGLASFGSGVEFIGVFLSVQCHPKVAGRPTDRTPVLSKEWLYDGTILDQVTWHPAIGQAAAGGAAVLLFGSIFAGRHDAPRHSVLAGNRQASRQTLGRILGSPLRLRYPGKLYVDLLVRDAVEQMPDQV